MLESRPRRKAERAEKDAYALSKLPVAEPDDFYTAMTAFAEREAEIMALTAKAGAGS